MPPSGGNGLRLLLNSKLNCLIWIGFVEIESQARVIG